MKKIIPVILLLLTGLLVRAQTPGIQLLTSGTKTSLRGLCVVNDEVVWVSGSNGMAGKSVDGGKSWRWMTVKGFEKTEFRDIEAFDTSTAIIMAVAEPAYLLKTTDGGGNWRIVYENKAKGMFLDAMDFTNDRAGIVIGDPVDGKVFMARTNDNGDTWEEMPGSSRPVADSGEAFFAASGSNLQVFVNNEYYMVSGGLRSRLFTPSSVTDLPMIQGRETTGANSIDIYDKDQTGKPGRLMAIAGGDFYADSSSYKNCFYSTDGGKKWKTPAIPPHGYRSCIVFLSPEKLLTCGTNGVDYSADGGNTWKWISKEGFHVCGVARTGKAVFLAGGNGKVGKIIWE
jgi:photosystem II stability/assembly factor-like uncharacterized protein